MQERYRILVVDDEADLRQAVRAVLAADARLECLEAADGEQALERVRQGDINLVLTDLCMPQLGGEELVRAIHQFNPEIPVLVMTGYGSIDGAVELMRRGAWDYLSKPFQVGELLSRVDRALERLRLLDEIRSLRRSVADRDWAGRLIGTSPAMLRVLAQIPSVARSDAAVILFGESGTGKELAARAIHAASPRSSQPFVSINCGALPETLLENELFGHLRGAYTDARDNYGGLIREAEGGTLLLDEIGEVSLATQVKLLRFLQEKEYRPLGAVKSVRANVRILSATNRDLRRAIADGSFREDLFYRLNIIPLTLPPLRDRKEDIPLLVRHFVRRAAADLGTPVESLAPLAIQKLMSYDWPGNVRELENKIQQIVALASTSVILPEQVDLPTSETIARPDGSLKSFREAKREVVHAFEVGYVTKLLAMTAGNVSEAARLARKHRRAFWEIMKKHDLHRRPRARSAVGPVEPAPAEAEPVAV